VGSLEGSAVGDEVGGSVASADGDTVGGSVDSAVESFVGVEEARVGKVVVAREGV